MTSKAGDVGTAAAFAESWNRVGEGSVYSERQFLEWFEPLDLAMVKNQDVLELGFGNGSLLVHMGRRQPRRLVGVELGDTVEQTKRNLRDLPDGMVELHRGDLCKVSLGTFDLVYCIGVLHHLEHPEEGFRAVLRHVRPGGRFHCWVYAWESNAIVRHVVEPIRRLASRLPWWLTKYAVALPLVIPYFLYAKSIALLARAGVTLSTLPLHDYSLWIAQRPFRFFHHVAFDQLVTPRTRYLRRGEVESWLSDPAIDPASVYVIFRNKNSWKFGGRVRRTAREGTTMDRGTGSSSAAVNREYYGELSTGRDDYWKLMAAPRARAETFARLVESFRPSTLADLGCGSGSLLRVMGELIPNAELVGIDLSESQIEMNRQELPLVTWLTHDLSGEKPLPPALEGRFEVVTASEIVEHVDRPEVFLQQARKLARAGAGHLVLSTQSGVIRETERRVGHRKHFAAGEMRELLQRSGWTPVRVWNEGFPFHDLSKWYANLDAEGSMRRFGEHSYGWSERLVCFALRALFKLNSRSRGAQLYAVARAIV